MSNRKPSRQLAETIFKRDNYTCCGCRQKFPTKYQLAAGEARTQNYLLVDHINGPSLDPANLQTLCFKCNSSKSGRSGNSFRLSIALKRLGPCVVYYPSLARLVGLKESIFLCQLIYWTPKGRHEKGDGWIYKSAADMTEETGLSYKEQIRLREDLVAKGLLEETYNRAEHVLYFKVNVDALDQLGEHLPNGHMPNGQEHLTKSQVAPDQREAGTLPNGISYKEAEITQETTQEITKRNRAEELARKILALRAQKQRTDEARAQLGRAIGTMRADAIEEFVEQVKQQESVH